MSAITEADAKTRWCPFARQLDWDDNQAGGAPVSANRHFDGSPSTRCLCIGSACMAWRLSFEQHEKDCIGHCNPPCPSRGYCGLAGKL